jgi:broad specificity phosphatase PhoE
MEETVEQRFWHVYITLPENPEKRYPRNKTLGVVAPTLQDAIDTVLKKHPGATVWTVNHRGVVDLLSFDYGFEGYHLEDHPKGVKF